MLGNINCDALIDLRPRLRWCVASSWCGDHGVQREIAEAALGHVMPGVEGDYRRRDALALRRQLMQRWADLMRNPLREALERLKRQYGDETFWREVNINGHLGNIHIRVRTLVDSEKDWFGSIEASSGLGTHCSCSSDPRAVAPDCRKPDSTAADCPSALHANRHRRDRRFPGRRRLAWHCSDRRGSTSRQVGALEVDIDQGGIAQVGIAQYCARDLCPV